MDPITMIGVGMIGKQVGSTVASWVTPNKSPWDRYQEKIGWIAGSHLHGSLSNDDIRKMVSTVPTVGADVQTMNAAAQSAQSPGLRDNRAVVEAVSDQIHAVNADLRVMAAKKKLSERVQMLGASSNQLEARAKWKQTLMNVAAERSVDDWEETDSKAKDIGGAIGMGIGLAAAGGYAMLKNNGGFEGTLRSMAPNAGEAPAFGSGIAQAAVPSMSNTILPMRELLLKKQLALSAFGQAGPFVGL